MAKKETIESIGRAESILKDVKMKSENCDPNIVFPLVSLHTISNKLYENYEDVKEDPALTFKIGEIIRDMEKYRGIFANNCGCKHK